MDLNQISMKEAGTLIVSDMSTCSNFENICHIDFLHLLTMYGFDVKSTDRYAFGGDDKAFTFSAILGESHFSIHTFPERLSVNVDLYICNSEKNLTKAIQFIQKLKMIFWPQISNTQVIKRYI